MGVHDEPPSMSGKWTNQLAGARMQVDQLFDDRIQDSMFTNQEWGLVMTAVEFEITDPEQPSEAELVANTENIKEIIPELDRIQKQMGGSPTPVDSGPSGGLFGRLQQYIEGLKTNSREGNERQKQETAIALVEDYTVELQDYLEHQGMWDDICSHAAEQS